MSFLDKKLGSKRQRGTIVGLHVELRPDKHGTERPKLVLDVDSGPSNVYRIDEAWVYGSKGMLAHTGLWWRLDVNGEVLAESSVGQLMRFLRVKTVRDLIGKEVELHPKWNHFLAVIATAHFHPDAK